MNAYRFGKWGNSIALFAICFFVPLLSYWLIADPKLSSWNCYPQPWFVYLFWGIMVVVFLGFNLGYWPFTKLEQPWMGISSTITIGIVTFFVVWFLCHAWGYYDPTFAWDRPNFAGLDAAGAWVLIGFFMWPILVLGMQHWPWVDLGLKQPWVGICEIMLGALLSIVAFMFLEYPLLAPWSTGEPLLSGPVLTGWYYACIEAMMISGNTWENWPWNKFKERWQIAISSFLGNIALGTVLYFIVTWCLSNFMLTDAVKSAIGPALPVYVAQYFVFASFTTIFWANMHPGEQWPTQYSQNVNRIIRTIVVFSIVTAFFYFYYYWFAKVALHENPVGGGFYGNALGYIDWMILIELIYITAFGQWGLFKKLETAKEQKTERYQAMGAE